MNNFDGCPICGKTLNGEGRKKHDLGYHYDYVLAQCGRNREVLKRWAKND